MAARDTTTTRGDGATGLTGRGAQVGRRLTTETKQFFKTSEFWAYVVVVIGILIAANSIESAEGGPDIFAADKAWLYIAILTVGYMISRGFAKSGVRDPYDESRGRDNGSH